MLNANNALGFAIRNKIDLTNIRADRNYVYQSFEMDKEDDNSSYDSFFLLARRLAGSAIQVYGQCPEFKRSSVPSIETREGIQVKRLRPGTKEDYVWLKDTENEMLQKNGKKINSKVTSYKEALPGVQSTKKEIKALDIEFNDEQKEYPKMLQLSNGKWLVSSSATSGKIVPSVTEAANIYQSFGGTINR